MPRVRPTKQYDSPRKCRFVGRVLADPKQNVAAAARAESINPRSARKIWHKFLETGTTHRRPGSGRPPLLTPNIKRAITQIVRHNRRMPFDRVGQRVGLHATSVRDYLASRGYHRCKAKHTVFLTAAQKEKRFDWGTRNRGRSRWDDVAWSDESYIYLDSARNAIFVTRRADEKYEEDCLIPTFKQSRLRVMVWGCIMHGRKGPLVVLEYPGGKGGGMTAVRYIAQVLEKAWMPFYTRAKAALRRTVYFQQDGAPAHTAKVTKTWLRTHRMQIFEHPASSPDMSPIEPLWQILKRRLRAQPRLPTTLEGLKASVKEVWDGIEVAEVNHLIDQMPERIQALLDNHGGHTKY